MTVGKDEHYVRSCMSVSVDNRCYVDLKLQGTNEPFQSPSFYTSFPGYQVCVSIKTDGDKSDEGTQVSVFAFFLEGEYDTELSWPFVGEITFTLLNQLEDNNHHSKTLALTNAHNVRVGNAWGYPDFIPHCKLGHDPVKNTQYLKDDTLYFRVSIKVANRKPWLECTDI